MTRSVKDIMVIGLDGAMYYFIKRFAEEGLLPNVKKFIDDGVVAEAFPCPPTDTPTNWTTIATGASTGTHGVASFYIHIPGEPFELGQKLRSRGQLTKYCKAEYLWNLADRYGIPSLVLNYPVCWPGNMRHGYVCLYTWSMPGATPMVVSHPKEYVVTTKSPDTGLIDGERLGLSSVKPVIAFRLVFKGGLIKEPATVELYAFDPDGSGYRLAIPRDGKFEVVDAGRWSDWIPITLRIAKSGMQGAGGKEVRCIFKVKHVGMVEDGLKVATSELFTTEGWVDPSGLEEDVVKSSHYLDDELALMEPRKKVEYDIFGEEARFLTRQKLEALRIARMAAYFKAKIRWRLCFLHYHIIDSVNHRFLGYLHPEFPFYDEEKVEFAWKYFEESYKILDEFIGLILKTCTSEDTLTIVVSDHAALPAWRVINIRRVFIEARLLRYRRSSDGYLVDWSGTKAFPWVEPLAAWVNLEGRDPQGVVKQKEYEEVREQVIDELQGLRDPETGERVTTMVLTREESVNIGWGDERAGDVVYFLRPPYTVWCGPLEDLLTYMATEGHLGKDWVFRDQSRVTGIHGYYLPNDRVDRFSNSSVFMAKGPGVKRGVELKKPVKLMDIAPTISYILGIPPPRDSEGRILHEILL